MSLDRNKAIARTWFDDLMNGRDTSAIDRVYAPDYRYRSPNWSVEGTDAAKSIAERLIEVMPDRVSTVIDQIAEGDRVATRWVSKGTPVQEIMGHEPDGGPIAVHGITLSTIRDSRIVEDWEIIDIVDG